MTTEQGSADRPVIYDWDTAPEPFRQAYKSLETDTKAKDERLAALEAKVATTERREKFDGVKSQIGDEANDVTLEDLVDLPTEQITDIAFRVKVEEKKQAKQNALSEQAKVMGFETPEEYQVALEAVKAAKAKEKQDLTDVAKVAGSGPAEPAAEKSDEEQAWEAYQKALTSGKPQDVAYSEYARVKRELATKKAEEAKSSV